MSQSLDSKSYCLVNLSRPEAFVYIIHESSASKVILDFLATELELENICYEVWDNIKYHLSPANITTTCVMKQ